MRQFANGNHWPRISGLSEAGLARARESRLEVLSFEPNPGDLGAKKFVPADLPRNAPLVVVLHGCTQTPEGYDRGTGWTHLAGRHGFAVLYPEQVRANNPNGCFNWFEPGDMRRGAGEPASIKAMIDRMIADHRLDPSRIYITGLSAGAAMSAVMLATYPETFAGGGLIAGLPYGTASSMPAAFSRMRGRGLETDEQLGDLVRGASAHAGPWPTVSIWHGTADMTVSAANGNATVAQWRDVHGLGSTKGIGDMRDGREYRVWRDATGRNCVEEYVITGMGHGTPVDTASVENVENAGAYLLDIGLSSTQCLAASWGLIEAPAPVISEALAPEIRQSARMPRSPGNPGITSARTDVQRIIEDALKQAGLMR